MVKPRRRPCFLSRSSSLGPSAATKSQTPCQANSIWSVSYLRPSDYEWEHLRALNSKQKNPSEVFIRTILLDKQASKGSSTSKIKSNYLNFTFLGRRRLKEQGSIQWRTIAQMREFLGWGICQRLNMFLLGQERWVSRLAKGNTRGEEGLVPNKGASLTLETTAKTSWNLTRKTLSHTRSSTTNHSWMRQRACRLQISCLLNPTLLT